MYRATQRYHFFPRKSSPLTHSPIFWEFGFFFPFLGKKTVFLFSLGQVCKPLTSENNDSPKKGKKESKKEKKTLFWTLKVFFFFQKKSENISFYFPGIVYTSLTHTFQRAGKNKQHWIKNTIFTHSLDFSQKVEKNELFRGNKKYDTYVLRRQQRRNWS